MRREGLNKSKRHTADNKSDNEKRETMLVRAGKEYCTTDSTQCGSYNHAQFDAQLGRDESSWNHEDGLDDNECVRWPRELKFMDSIKPARDVGNGEEAVVDHPRAEFCEAK